jgi:hypothetical protein
VDDEGNGIVHDGLSCEVSKKLLDECGAKNFCFMNISSVMWWAVQTHVTTIGFTNQDIKA